MLKYELNTEEGSKLDEPDIISHVSHTEIQLTFDNTKKDVDDTLGNSHQDALRQMETKALEINQNSESNHTEAISEWKDYSPQIESNSGSNHTEIRINSKKIETDSEINHTEIYINSDMNDSLIDKLDTEVVTESSIEKPAPDLENDSPIGELPLANLQDSAMVLTSTPVKKMIEVKNLILDDDDDDDAMDDVPYMASSKQQASDDSPAKYAAAKTANVSSTFYSPVTISIPVIKPDLTQFEKLPSPPPTSTHPGLEPSWRISKTLSTDENGKSSLERISVQSLYKPIFTSKEINSIDEPTNQTEKLVNGNESDLSEHYSTAQENTSTSSIETSSLSVTMSSPVTKEVTKTPNTIAGFAKTLIIPSPNDVENLLSLAAEPITPPPMLEPPTQKVENE